MPTIKWTTDNRFESWGRSGRTICTGLTLIDTSTFGYVSIRPVNSKDTETYGCRIEVPSNPAELEKIGNCFLDLANEIRSRSKTIKIPD